MKLNRPMTFRTRARQAVFLYEGRTWYGRIFAWQGGRWECIESVSQLSQSPWELPPDLLDSATKHRARRVRILLPSDVHRIQLDLPQDLEPEERHTALAFELAQETGQQPDQIRLAAVRAGQFSMGGTDDVILACAFERTWLDQYDQTCRQAGLRFDGVGSLELAALNAHARREPNARLLLLRSQSGFYAAPAAELLPFMAQSVGVGVEPLDDAARDQERLDRAARSFGHNRQHVHLWCTQTPSESRKHQLQQTLGADVAVEFIDFTDRVTPVATHAAWARRVGQVTAGCALVGLPSKPRSPYRAGSWMCLTILLLTVLYIGLCWQGFNRDLKRTDERTAAWSELERQRKQVNGQVDQLRQVQQRCVAMEQLMQRAPLSSTLLTILWTLGDHWPAYTCVTSIRQTADRGYEIRGTTYYQEGLIGLQRELGLALADSGLIVEPGEMTVGDDHQKEREFVYRISPQSGGTL